MKWYKSNMLSKEGDLKYIKSSKGNKEHSLESLAKKLKELQEF